jgi:outer membrane protein OmpA-like peptidoglycan-associated protein
VRKVLSATALSAILVAGLGLSGAAMAQSPSVLQTIEALKPRPGKSRGSRPVVAPPASTPSAAGAASHAVVAPAPVAGAPAARPVVASVPPTPAPAAASDADAPAIDFNILFATGSADLQPAAVKTLETLGQALASADLAGSRFRIEGHTDTVGTRDENQALSARRAAAVVQFLTDHYHIDPARLESIGKGEDDLRIKTGDQVNEPRNRRVRVVNVTG